MVENGSSKKHNPCDPENVKKKRERKKDRDTCCGCGECCPNDEHCCECMCCGCNLCCCCKCIWDILKCCCNALRCLCETLCSIGDCCCYLYFICCNACLCVCRIGRCIFRDTEESHVETKDYFNVTYKDYNNYVNSKQTKELVVKSRNTNTTEKRVSQQHVQQSAVVIAMQAPQSPQSQKAMMQQQHVNVPVLTMKNSGSAGSMSSVHVGGNGSPATSPVSQPIQMVYPQSQASATQIVYLQQQGSNSPQQMAQPVHAQGSPQVMYVAAPQQMVLVPAQMQQYPQTYY